VKLVVYDCETKHCIPSSKTEPLLPGVIYCNGWTDYAGMGISIVTAYIWGEGYRVFLADNMDEFKVLAADPNTIMAGFHSERFDNRLVKGALGVEIDPHRSFDLLRAIAKAVGVNPDGVPHGYGLSAMCEANFLPRKQRDGVDAPLLWQRGCLGALIDYGLGDTIRTKKLIELAVDGRLRSPINFRCLELDVSAIAHLVRS
jgi:hypothetical protein